MNDKKYLRLFVEYEQKVFILLFAIFFLGFLCGCYYLFDNNQYKTEYVFSNIIFLKNIVLMCITFLLGFAVIGFPFIILCTAYVGILSGVSIGLFMLSHGFKVSVLYSLAFFPYYLVYIFCFIYVAGSSLRLSASLYNVFKEGTRYISPKTYSRPHILNFLLFLFLIVFISFIYFLIL